MLGLYPRLKPPFAKRYADLYTPMADALRTYAEEVCVGGTACGLVELHACTS